MAARPRVPARSWSAAVTSGQVCLDDYPELPRRGGCGLGPGQLPQRRQRGQFKRIVDDLRALWRDGGAEEEGRGRSHDHHRGTPGSLEGYGAIGGGIGTPDYPPSLIPGYHSAESSPGQAQAVGEEGRGTRNEAGDPEATGVVPDGMLIWHVLLWSPTDHRTYPRAARRGHLSRVQVPPGPLPSDRLEHLWSGHNGAGAHDRSFRGQVPMVRANPNGAINCALQSASCVTKLIRAACGACSWDIRT